MGDNERIDRTGQQRSHPQRFALVLLGLLVVVVVLLVVFLNGGQPPLPGENESTVPESAIAVDSCSALRDIDDDLSATYVLTRDLDCAESQNWNDGE